MVEAEVVNSRVEEKRTKENDRVFYDDDVNRINKNESEEEGGRKEENDDDGDHHKDEKNRKEA